MPFLGKAPGTTTVNVADDAITTAKVADNAITSAKIGVDVIVAEDLAANSITVSEITDGAITEAKLNIDNTPTNDYVLTAKSSAAGGLTWAASQGGWSATTEGRVTTTSGQNNIDFTIPADVNMIKIVFWGISQVSQELFKIKVGNTSGTLVSSGLLNTSTYWYHNGANTLAENTGAIQLNGWTAAGNYWYGSLNMESVGMDGRRWTYFMAPYNDTYGEYFTMCNGRISFDSGEQLRKIRFTTDSGNGYDSGGQIIVYTAEF